MGLEPTCNYQQTTGRHHEKKFMLPKCRRPPPTTPTTRTPTPTTRRGGFRLAKIQRRPRQEQNADTSHTSRIPQPQTSQIFFRTVGPKSFFFVIIIILVLNKTKHPSDNITNSSASRSLRNPCTPSPHRVPAGGGADPVRWPRLARENLFIIPRCV